MEIEQYGAELRTYVDDGAINWKIGTLEKYCSVLAADHFVRRWREAPLATGMRELVDGLAQSKDQLVRLGISPPIEFNFMFHQKTPAVFLWFAERHKLTWDQLLGAIEYIRGGYERQIIETFGRKKDG